MSHQAIVETLNSSTIRARILGIQGPPGVDGISNLIELADYTYTATDGQEDFEVSGGYVLGTNSLLVFVNGDYVPTGGVVEVDETHFRLQPVAAGATVQVKIVKHTEPEIPSIATKEWIVISEVEPSNISVPQFWFKPSLNRLSLYRDHGVYESVALISDFESEDPGRIHIEGGSF